ncbi:35373_t:CDS:2 [Gigaspora margarita]|uniref:35373_t:CDS:1 n=1 Tax=Gigaspora margarita TaxID=4874 RepID=A0ABN7UGM6_GIGMA|nr:35373_t:CDS:2 [Gigaspora margarita]
MEPMEDENRTKTSSTYSDQGPIPMELDRTEVNKRNGPVRTNKEKKVTWHVTVATKIRIMKSAK